MTVQDQPDLAVREASAKQSGETVPVEPIEPVPDQPTWQRWLLAFWKAMRPYGVAAWRHPPRGA